jgi:hypothetical protein
MSKEWWLEIRIKCEKCGLEKTISSKNNPLIITECHNCYHDSFLIVTWYSSHNIISKFPEGLQASDRISLDFVEVQQ